MVLAVAAATSVAACTTYGSSVRYLRLQVRAEAAAAQGAAAAEARTAAAEREVLSRPHVT